MGAKLTNTQRDVLFKRLLIRVLLDRGVITVAQRDELKRFIPYIAVPMEYE